MKIFLIIFLSIPIIGFSQKFVDTIIAYEHLPIRIDTIDAPAGIVIGFADSAYAYPSNISYYIKFYDLDSNIVFEALEYNKYRIGKYIDYYKNGNIKTIGNYTNFIFRKNGKVRAYPEKTKEWIYYSKSGKQLRTENYP